MRRPLSSYAPSLLGACLSISAVNAQATPFESLRLYGRLDSTDTHLVDTRGNRVHTWPSTYQPGTGCYLEPDGTLLRAIQVGLIGGGSGGGVQRVALDGTVLWDFRINGGGLLSHHDLAPLPNGNVLMIVWEDLSNAAAAAAGRDPATLNDSVFRPDRIVEVEQTGPSSGRIVWQWRVFEHLVQDFDPTKANFANVASHPERIDINYPPTFSNDWTHFNGVDYDPVNDLVVMSASHQNEIWVVDHSTTTAEAAGSTGGRLGRGGDLVYRWGNPLAYRAGTVADQQLFFQHSPRFVPQGYPGAGNLTIFNNRAPGGSSVVEIVLPLDSEGRFVFGANGRFGPPAPVWSYAAPGFNTVFISSAERLPNGNTLICSGGQGWLFEVTPAGQLVWEHRAGGYVFHAHSYNQHLWQSAPTVSRAVGGRVDFDLIAGSAHAGAVHALLGSLTGTGPGTLINGHVLPLIVDDYTLMTLAPDPFVYLGNIGTLDALGRGRVSFDLPGGVVPPVLVGLEIHHAFGVIDPSGRVVLTSDAQTLRIVD